MKKLLLGIAAASLLAGTTISPVRAAAGNPCRTLIEKLWTDYGCQDILFSRGLCTGIIQIAKNNIVKAEFVLIDEGWGGRHTDFHLSLKDGGYIEDSRMDGIADALKPNDESNFTILQTTYENACAEVSASMAPSQ